MWDNMLNFIYNKTAFKKDKYEKNKKTLVYLLLIVMLLCIMLLILYPQLVKTMHLFPFAAFVISIQILINYFKDKSKEEINKFKEKHIENPWLNSIKKNNHKFYAEKITNFLKKIKELYPALECDKNLHYIRCYNGCGLELISRSNELYDIWPKNENERPKHWKIFNTDCNEIRLKNKKEENIRNNPIPNHTLIKLINPINKKNYTYICKNGKQIKLSKDDIEWVDNNWYNECDEKAKSQFEVNP